MPRVTTGPVVAPKLPEAPKPAPAALTVQPMQLDTQQFAASSIDDKLAALKKLRSGHTDRSDEKKILDLLRTATPAELNGILERLPQHELHELIDDMNDRWFGPDNRKAFFTLLSKERIGDLGVEARGRLIATLQYHRTHGDDEGAIRDVFLATRGADLTALKNLVDRGGDYRDLQQLVFHDLDDAKVRRELLAHFAKEGTALNGQVKVLSDIDDTFYANFRDDRYPGKTVYPGVRALYAELDKGGGPVADRSGDLSFLSARPYDRPGLAEDHTLDMLHGNGVDATVLSGDWAHLVGNTLIADKKLENWKQTRQLFPEYQSVFIGDSGQGDAIFGERAVAANDQMKAVFIHNVTDMSDADRAQYAAKGVFVFDTYVGAAVEAFKRGLISRDGLQRVATAAKGELDDVVFSTPEQKQARVAELTRDLAAMKAVLSVP